MDGFWGYRYGYGNGIAMELLFFFFLCLFLNQVFGVLWLKAFSAVKGACVGTGWRTGAVDEIFLYVFFFSCTNGMN